MPAASYHGGHSFADLIRDLRLHLSLPQVQDELARQISSGEIVLSRELPQGWYLALASLRQEGDGWVRFGGCRIVIVISGKQRDPAEWRYHIPEPQLRDPPEPIVEEEPPQPDADLPSIATEDPPASDAASLSSGQPAGHAGHSLAVILEGWHHYPYSLPQVQEYAAQLLASGDMVLSEGLPEGWSLVSNREVLRSYGVRNRSIIIAMPGGKGRDPAEIRCHFPNDPRLVGPLQLSRLQKPVAAQESTTDADSQSEPPKTDADSQPQEQSGAAPEQPKAALDNGTNSRPSEERESGPRHPDWPKIVKHWDPIVKSRGRWLNANAAADEILEKQKGLTIDQGTLYKGIRKFFPQWIGLEPKE